MGDPEYPCLDLPSMRNPHWGLQDIWRLGFHVTKYRFRPCNSGAASFALTTKSLNFDTFDYVNQIPASVVSHLTPS